MLGSAFRLFELIPDFVTLGGQNNVLCKGFFSFYPH